MEKYKDKDLPLQPVHQSDLEQQPESYKGMRDHNADFDHDSVVHLLEPTEEQRLEQRQHYMANVTMIDDKVGEIIAALEAKGQLDNTIIIFSSDHGDCLTDHGHSQKWTMYDTVTRVPLIVWAPGKVQANSRCEAQVQLMDIGPTILEYAGIDIPKTFEAESFKSALEGQDFAGREYVFAEQIKDKNYTEGHFQTMVRSKDWKLVHFLNEPYGQLFNLKEDPDEFENLWHSSEHQSIREELLGVLRDWHIRSTIHTATRTEDWR